jgi:hypothetical protein
MANEISHLTTTCHRERSVAIYWQGDCFHHATSVAHGRLTFRLSKKILLGIRNDKVRGQEPRASAKRLSWQGDYHAVLSARLVMTNSGLSWRT